MDRANVRQRNTDKLGSEATENVRRDAIATINLLPAPVSWTLARHRSCLHPIGAVPTRRSQSQRLPTERQWAGSYRPLPPPIFRQRVVLASFVPARQPRGIDRGSDAIEIAAMAESCARCRAPGPGRCAGSVCLRLRHPSADPDGGGRLSGRGSGSPHVRHRQRTGDDGLQYSFEGDRHRFAAGSSQGDGGRQGRPCGRAR